MKKNDDQRMKDLTNRVVAMSPDPPPFPEEVTMTTPARRTTMKPLTVFAAAAVVVLLGFGIPYLLMNGGGPPVAVPDTTTTTSTPVETTTTSGLDTTTTTEAILVPGAEVGVSVFLFQSPENSFLGNPALVPVLLPVELPEDADDTEAVKAAINTLGDPDLTLSSIWMNAVPEGVEALEVRRADGTDNALIIEMNEAFLDGAGGVLADFTMLNQLIYTATAFEGIEEVHFIVNNEPIVAFGSEGLGLESSVNRETFQENLGLIYLTEPVVADGDGTMQIVGISNTFEATVNLIVRNGAGEVVHETFTSATCGTGCWGDFEFTIDESLVDADSTIEVFEYSAEDGDPANVITVPVTVIEGS